MAEKEIKTAVEDFDWDAFENGDTHAGKSREELTKTYDESLNTVKDKEVIEGTIIALNKREAVVNIGYKSDGIIPFSEFRYNPDIKRRSSARTRRTRRASLSSPTARLAQPVRGTASTRPWKRTRSSRATSSAVRKAA